MNTGKTFNAIFWTLFALMFLMRFRFGFRVWQKGERLLPDRADLQREGFWTVTLDRLFSLLVAAVVLLWFLGNSLRSLEFPAPDWLRWVGFGLGITSVELFAWAHAALGRFWSTALLLRLSVHPSGFLTASCVLIGVMIISAAFMPGLSGRILRWLAPRLEAGRKNDV